MDEYAKKSEIPVVPTKVSQLQNDANYLTEHQSLAEYAKKTDIPTKTSELTNDSNFLTAHQDISGLATKAELTVVENKIPDTTNFALKSDIPDTTGFATKDEIPTKVSELTNDENYLTEHQSLEEYAKITDVSAGLSEKADTDTVVSKTEYDALKARFDYLEKYVNDYLALTQQELEEKNDEIISNLSPQKQTVDILTPMESIVVPDAQNTAYTINAPLQNEATVELTSNKFAYLNNTSEEPVDVTFFRNIPESETSSTSNPILYITGNYNNLTVENISLSQRDTENEVGSVNITENNTKAISLTLSLKDGATITNDSSAPITITNKNTVDSDVIVVAPNSSVTLQSGSFNELQSTVSESTLYINKAHINKLVVKHGNVVVNDYSVESHIDEIVNDTEYTVTPRTYEVFNATDIKKVANTPALYILQNDINGVASITPGILGSSAKIDLNSYTLTSTGSNGAFMLRGNSHFIIENGKIDATSYGIWLSGAGKVELNNVEIIADAHALYIEKTGGEIFTSGNCTFSVKGEDKRYVANYYDSVYSGGWTHGFHFGAGTRFIDFNPAASMGEPGGPVNLLDEGFTITLSKETIDGVEHDVYTVVAE